MKEILFIAFIQYCIFLLSGKKSTILGCGLVGFSGNNPYNFDKIRTLLLWNSIKRGRDATGIFTPETGLIKNNSAAVDFLSEADIKKLKPDTMLVGHVRAGTVGVNTKKNAHPFEYGNLVVAHNGTLDNPNSLGHKYDMKSKDWDVDSQTLAFGLHKNYETKKEGEDIYQALSQYDGAAALIWYNKETKLLYTYHDKNRPLFYGWDAAGDMYISSLKESLENTECFAVEEFEVNTLYTIKDAQIQSKELYKTYLELNPPKVIEKQVIDFTKKDDIATPRPINLVGYNLQVLRTERPSKNTTTNFNTKYASVTKNKWYEVTAYYKDVHYAVEILDDNNQKRSIFLSNLDLTNYQPFCGYPVKCIRDVFGKRSGKKIFNAGQITEVIKLDYFKNLVELKTNLGEIFYVPTNLVRVLDAQEEDEFFKSDDEKKQLSIAHFMQAFKEPEEPNGSKDEDDEYMDSSIYKSLVADIAKLVDELEDVYALGAESDITPQINCIRSKLKSHILQYKA